MAVTLLVHYLAQKLIEARQASHLSRTRRDTSSADRQGGFVHPNGHLEAFLGALLFALHPVHTEAVAGIVGQAELLCAALAIPALLCYMAASSGHEKAHSRYLAASVLLGWAAALAKEVGITIVSC